MSVFTPHLNPLTGKNEWELRPAEYDFHQEIARSAFADMLHDVERNHKYHVALRKAMDCVKKQGKRVKVLDIGTGSGLLAMMAAKYGADSVHACEAFIPVAERAKQVIADNKLSDKIVLIPKRSTELQVGQGKDMEEKANVLVTEVFDTELIGEGAVETFTHALRELLEPDSMVVPHAATVYAQVVQSPLLNSFHALLPIEVDSQTCIRVPKSISECAGASAVHDLQISQLHPSEFVALSKPVPVFRFNFTDANTMSNKDHQAYAIVAEETGRCHAVIMWWELAMDQENKIVLSCAPCWAHPEAHKAPWRDHWMQGVYYPPDATEVKKGEMFYLTACRDQYSMWFSVTNKEVKQEVSHPVCTCGLHMMMSQTRVAMLNDVGRHKKFISTLRKIVTSDTVCLCLGSGSQLPFIAARLGAKKVYTVETDSVLRGVAEEYIAENDLSSVMVLDGIPEHLPDSNEDKMVNIILAEPFFNTSLLPWHNLHFWFLLPALSHLLAPGTVIVPCRAVFRAVAVQFIDLWKIRAPVQCAEGFDLSSFDELVQSSQGVSDDPVEPQPLWEYPAIALTEPFSLATFDLSLDLPSSLSQKSGTVCFETCGKCNAVAIWTDFELDSENMVTTGPREKVQPGSKVCWDQCSRQGVYFFKNSGQHVEGGRTTLDWSMTMNPKSGTIQIAFGLVNFKTHS